MTADPKLELLRSRLLSDQRRRLLQAAESKVLLAAGALSFVGAAEGALAALEALIRERDETGRTASVPTPALVSVPAASQASETDSAGFAPTAVITGTVKWFNATKGFGFIAPDDGGPDAFVHITAVERAGIGNLHNGQRLTYTLVPDGRTGRPAADTLKPVA